MINKDFLKKLKLLYVEDDDIAREKLTKILRRIFDNVLVASNGEEGYILFRNEKLNNNKIDIIVSDINMPKMNGLDMFEKIKELDCEIPIIYTTARTESTELLKAIELHANHYILKPIDAEDVIERIQKVCEKSYYQELVTTKSRELEHFLGVVDNVAYIMKMNSHREITYVNYQFVDALELEKRDIVGKKYDDIVHKDMPKSAIDKIWNKITKGKVWRDDIKYQSLKKEIFFIKSTIFQVIHDDGLEYINIGFLSTDEVEQKREFHKKIISNIKQNKEESVQLNNKINVLETQLERSKGDDYYIQKSNEELKEKNNILRSQLNFFEDELTKKDKFHTKSLKSTKANIERVTDLYKKALGVVDIQKKDIKNMGKEVKIKKNEIIKLEDVVKEQRDIIKGLRDTIKNIDEDKNTKKKKTSFMKKLLNQSKF